MDTGTRPVKGPTFPQLSSSGTMRDLGSPRAERPLSMQVGKPASTGAIHYRDIVRAVSSANSPRREGGDGCKDNIAKGKHNKKERKGSRLAKRHRHKESSKSIRTKDRRF